MTIPISQNAKRCLHR